MVPYQTFGLLSVTVFQVYFSQPPSNVIPIRRLQPLPKS